MKEQREDKFLKYWTKANQSLLASVIILPPILFSCFVLGILFKFRSQLFDKISQPMLIISLIVIGLLTISSITYGNIKFPNIKNRLRNIWFDLGFLPFLFCVQMLLFKRSDIPLQDSLYTWYGLWPIYFLIYLIILEHTQNFFKRRLGFEPSSPEEVRVPSKRKHLFYKIGNSFFNDTNYPPHGKWILKVYAIIFSMAFTLLGFSYIPELLKYLGVENTSNSYEIVKPFRDSNE